MTWNIGVYETDAAAKAVATKLTKAGLRGRKVFYAGRLAGQEEVAVQTFATDAGLPIDQVKDYARMLQGGRSLVAVEAPSDRTPEAIQILKSRAMTTSEISGPAESGPPPETPKKSTRPNPAPFSTWLGVPTLAESKPRKQIELSNDPAPLSSLLGLRTLTTSKPTANIELSSDPAPLSSMMGWATLKESKPSANIELSSDPAPLSSMLGWSTLKESKPNVQLKSDPAPFSRWLGWPTLMGEDK